MHLSCTSCTWPPVTLLAICTFTLYPDGSYGIRYRLSRRHRLLNCSRRSVDLLTPALYRAANKIAGCHCQALAKIAVANSLPYSQDPLALHFRYPALLTAASVLLCSQNPVFYHFLQVKKMIIAKIPAHSQ